MKKPLALLVLLFAIAAWAAAQEPLLTRAEKTGYRETSLYADVIDFIFQLQARSPQLKISHFATSAQGRMIPLVIASKEGVARPQDLRGPALPCVLVMANIHAGEIEGKEAALILLREIAEGRHPGLLESQVILFLPILNPDGNEKLGRNRRDNGPELAGVRYNGQNLDLNRDFLKLESPEISALVALFNSWDPVLFLDMHTTNGSYHRHPVTYTTSIAANTDERLGPFMWQKLFPAAARTLKMKYGYESLPYGNFAERADPQKGWINDSIEPRYSTNYAGLRNRLAILNENYSYADFQTRVQSSLGFVKAVLEYSAANIGAMSELVRAADRETAKSFRERPFVLESRLEKLMDVTVQSFEFVLEKIREEDRAKYPAWFGDTLVRKTDIHRDYTLPYMARSVPVRSRRLPEGYLLMPEQTEAAAKLRAHGVRLERLFEGYTEENAEAYKIERIETDKTIFQGHVAVKLSGDYQPRRIAVPKGAWYVPLSQPLARLAAVLLEPDMVDSLAAWGFFNRVLVQQWSNAPGEYPVYRVFRRPPPAAIVD